MQNKRNVIVVIIALLAMFGIGGYLYKSNETKEIQKKAQEQSSKLQRTNSFIVGKEDAKVQLVEFFDPACETCAQFHYYIKDLLKENSEIKLVLRYAPFHKNSGYAAVMLEGAREQGKFMDALEIMFATQKIWTKNHSVEPQILWNVMQNVEGLDMEKLSEYMNSGKADAIINQDIEDGKALGVNKTPSYFVNGKPLIEFGYQNLINLINSEM